MLGALANDRSTYLCHMFMPVVVGRSLVRVGGGTAVALKEPSIAHWKVFLLCLDHVPKICGAKCHCVVVFGCK